MGKDVIFGICADVHHNLWNDMSGKMSRFIAEANEREVDFIIELGDFSLPGEFGEKLMAEWRKFKGPSYHVLGNHDAEHGGKEAMLAFTGQKEKYYSFDVGDYHFIVLDTNYSRVGNEYFDYSSERRADFHNCFIPDFEIEWLKKDIDATDKRCFIFTHAVMELGDWRIYNTHQVREALWLINQKAGYNKVTMCFSGHDHADELMTKGGIHYMLVNSMSHKYIGEMYTGHSSHAAQVKADYGRLSHEIPYKDPLYAFVRLKSNGLIQIIGKQSEYVGNSPLELHWEHYASPQIMYREVWMNGHGEL